MLKSVVAREILSIDISPQEHREIKILAALHGKTTKKYVLESIRDRIRRENEENALLKVTGLISPVMQEIWDNDKDSVYDEL